MTFRIGLAQMRVDGGDKAGNVRRAAEKIGRAAAGGARTALATFGLMVCADAFAAGQIVSRTLALMSADVIVSPSAWAVPAGHDNARTPYGQDGRCRRLSGPCSMLSPRR